jgi:hypothetical protein
MPLLAVLFHHFGLFNIPAAKKSDANCCMNFSAGSPTLKTGRFPVSDRNNS